MSKSNNSPQDKFFQKTALASAISAALVMPQLAYADNPPPPPLNPLLVSTLADTIDNTDGLTSIREAIQFANSNDQVSNTITFAQNLTGTIEVSETLAIDKNLSITGPGKDVLTLQSNNSDLFTINDPEAGTEDGLDFDLSAVTFLSQDSERNDNQIIRHQSSHGGKISLNDIRVHEDTHASGLVFSQAQDNDISISLKDSQIAGVICEEENCSNEKSLKISYLLAAVNPLGSSEIIIENTSISNIFSQYLLQTHGNDANITIKSSQFESIDGNSKSVFFNATSEQNSASINLQDSSVKNSTLGLIFEAYSQQEGNVNIEIINSNIDENKTDFLAFTGGRSDTVAGTFTMTNSSMSNNELSYTGLIFDTNQTVSIINSSINNNTLNVDDCCPQDEQAILNFDFHTTKALIISNTSINNNSLRAISIEGHSTNELLIENSAITNNTTLSVNGGAGIYLNNDDPEQPLSLKIINTTLSGNQSSAATGGAIKVENANLTIAHSTIANNAAKGSAGGIYNKDGNVTISNSIIAGNGIISEASTEEANFEETINNADLMGDFIITYSLVQDINNTVNGDKTSGWNTSINDVAIQLVDNALLGADALLQNLAIKGGLTPVHDLAENSPARNAGLIDDGIITEFDQRGEGFPRLTGEVLDLGAVQFHSNPIAVNDSATLEVGAGPINIQVLSNDASSSNDLALDLTSIVIMEHPAHGEVEVQTDGSLTFSLTDDFTGNVSITYTVADIAGNRSNQATVDINITEAILPEPDGNPENLPEAGKKKSSGGATYWLVLILGMLGLRRFRK